MNDERIFELLAQHQGPAEVTTEFAETLFGRLEAERRRRRGWLAQMAMPLVPQHQGARRLALLLAVVALMLMATIVGLALSRPPRPQPIAVLTAGPLVVVYSDDSRRTVSDQNSGDVLSDASGERLLFESGPPRKVYEVRADGSGLRSILVLGRDDHLSAADWSPSEDRIAVAVANYATVDRRTSVMVLEPDNPDEPPIVFDGTDPQWSPDGSFISILSRGSSGEPEISVASSGEWNPRRVAAGGPVSSGARPWLEPLAWSPDSKWLLYRASDDLLNPWSLWVVRPDGSERRKLYDGQGSWGHWPLAPWLSDSSGIAVEGPREADGDTIDIVTVSGALQRITPLPVELRAYDIDLIGVQAEHLIWIARGGWFDHLGTTSVHDHSSSALSSAMPYGLEASNSFVRGDTLSWTDDSCLEMFQVNSGITTEHCLEADYPDDDIHWVGAPDG